MSEKAPQPSRFQEALNNFDENMGKEWENRLQGEAGKTDFSGDAKKQLEEAEAYYRHMEGLDGKDRGEEIYNEQVAAHGREWEEAIADDEAFNQARTDALEVKFSSSPTLRRMRNISREIADLRNETNINASNEKEFQERLKKREDALNELLVAYEASDEFDPTIADMLMDPADNALRNVAAGNALREQNQSVSTKNQVEAVDETDPVAQIVDIANTLDDPKTKEALESNPDTAKAVADALAEAQRLADEEPDKQDTSTDDTRLKQPTKMPVGPTLSERLAEGEKDTPAPSKELVLVKSLPSNEVAVRPEDQPKIDLNDPRIASIDVNGNPLYFSDKFVQRMERDNENVFKRAWSTMREKIANRERGRKGLKVALGMMASLSLAAGIAGALSGDKAPSESTTVDSGTNAPADPTRGTEPKPTPPPAGETKSAHEKLLESPAWNIPKGSGGEAMMNRLHVDKGIWYENEAEFQKKFPGEAYWMQDGHVGLRDPGALPMSAREFWATKIEQQK